MNAVERGPRPEGGENVNRNEWLAFLRSNDSEAKELLALHPGMKPPDESTWREAMKELWKDPGFRARHAAAVRENWKDPGFRARNAAAVRENWKDPGFRARHAAAVRENLEGPGVPGSECGGGPGGPERTLEGPGVPGSACGGGP